MRFIQYKMINSYSICQIQREKKNMPKTLKYFYAMILFLSLFLIAKEVNGKPYFHSFQFCLITL